jgi:hypothetical protein
MFACSERVIDAASFTSASPLQSGVSAQPIDPPFRVALAKLWRDDGLTFGHSGWGGSDVLAIRV